VGTTWAVVAGIWAAAALAVVYAIHARRASRRAGRDLLARLVPDLDVDALNPDDEALDRIFNVIAEQAHLPPRSPLGRHDKP